MDNDEQFVDLERIYYVAERSKSSQTLLFCLILRLKSPTVLGPANFGQEFILIFSEATFTQNFVRSSIFPSSEHFKTHSSSFVGSALHIVYKMVMVNTNE